MFLVSLPGPTLALRLKPSLVGFASLELETRFVARTCFWEGATYDIRADLGNQVALEHLRAFALSLLTSVHAIERIHKNLLEREREEVDRD